MMRSYLLAGTALLIATPAHAQLSPNAQPRGGAVSAGSATIAQTAARTTVTQSSQRAAVDWQSFDVGSSQAVTFAQPSSSAVTLNRVNSANPSLIAGRIDANGQVVITNQSGVVFERGAQVNAAGLVVSAAGITNQNFMSGRMVFDQAANPNARVENSGTISVRDVGLAALVAPAVANKGVINAKLGHVVLAGAETHTLDLYGDGMLSIDVTGQVTQAPVDRHGHVVTSLVTNTGVINADGGTVVLTAKAVDGVVQNLVTADGHVYANTLGGRTGTVIASGSGGSVQVLGEISAVGRGAGNSGGQIAVNASGNVTLGPKAKLDASGRGGGGTIAVGTTLARARGGAAVTPTLTAANVTLAPGSRVAADATVSGNGGRVTLLSTGTTTQQGRITARGGRRRGNGGFVEVSGGTVALGAGSVDVSAPKGTPGTILLDPLDLYISNGANQPDGTSAVATTPGTSAPNVTAAGNPDGLTTSYVTPAQLAALTGNIDLQATRDIIVNSPVLLTAANQGLTLEAGRNIDVEAAISVPGNLVLKAGTAATPIYTGTLTVNANLTAGGVVYLAGSDMTLDAVIASTGPNPQISLVSTNGFTFFPGTTQLQAPGGVIELGPVTTGEVFTPSTLDSSLYSTAIVRIGQTHDPVTGAVGNTYQGISFNQTPTYTVNGKALQLFAAGDIIEPSGTVLQNVALITGSSGTLNLPSAGNNIAAFGPYNAAGALTVTDGTALSLSGALSGTSLNVSAVGTLTLGGTIATNAVGTGGVGGAMLQVLPDASGNALFMATAQAAVNALSSGATLVVALPAQNGQAVFAALAAPAANVTLDLGSGTASGTINVGNLTVNGQNGSAVFTNSLVQGLTGTAAAGVSILSPAGQAAYTLNGCVIGSATCTGTTTATTGTTTSTTTMTTTSTTTTTTTGNASTTTGSNQGVVTGVGAVTTVGSTVSSQAADTTAGALAAVADLTPQQAEVLALVGDSNASGVSNVIASQINSVSQAATAAISQTRSDPRGVPLVNPLRDLANGPLRNRQDDPDLLLPNVSEKDY